MANQFIDEIDAVGQHVDIANRKIPDLVKQLEYDGYEVTAIDEGDLLTDASVTIGDYYVQILVTGEYALAHKCADGKIQYWPECQHMAEVLVDLDKATWGERLQTVVAAVETLRDLVGGDAKIEYEWLDDNNASCQTVTTIDEHLEELHDCIDPDFCPLDPLTVSAAGVWCERHKRWQYAVCGKTDGAVSKQAVMDHYASLRHRPGDDAPGLQGRLLPPFLEADPHAYDPVAFLEEALGIPKEVSEPLLKLMHEREEVGGSASPDLIRRAKLERYVVPGRRYPRPLPSELEAAYVYTRDGGHSILIVLENEYIEGTPAEGYLVPAPVRAVLRAGYRVRDGLVWCTLPYSSEVGLLTEDGDDEY
ncbi:MAG: hypothetical protein WC129_03030 [Sphaerochaetaceae bacterium]